MENLLAPFLTLPPWIFWNLLCLSFFHFLALLVLRSRLKQLGEALPPSSDYEPTVFAIMVLEQLTSQEIRSIQAMCSQVGVKYRLLILANSEVFREKDRLHVLLEDYPQLDSQLCPLEDYCSKAFPEGFISPQVESLVLAAGVRQAKMAPAELQPDVLAVIRSQLVPHVHWLKQLVLPLNDETVAATTVCPWFRPFSEGSSGLSSLLQYVWNGFSALQFLLLPQVSWSGAIAIKPSFFTPVRLRLWQNLGATDIALGRLIDRKQLTVRQHLSLMTVRRTPIQFSVFFQEVKQRLGDIRRHHSLWFILGGQGLFVSFTAFRAYRRLVSDYFSPENHSNPWLYLGVGIYWLVIALMIVVIEDSVGKAERQLSENGKLTSKQKKRKLSWLVLGPVLLLLSPLIQLAHCLTIIFVLFRKQYRPQRRLFAFLQRKRSAPSHHLSPQGNKG